MITKITKEQESKIPEYIEKWVRRVSQPLNRDKTVKITKELFGEDKTVLVAESIQNAIDIIRLIIQDKKIEYSSQLDSQLRSQLGDKVSYSWYTTQYWLSWVGYYDFAQFIGVKFDTDKLSRMEEILMSIPSIITLGNILIVIENPICRWEEGRLHDDQKPAIEWADGTGIYLLDGVKFEKEAWEKVVSKKMTFKEIMAIEKNPNATAMQALLCGLTLNEYMSMSLES